MQSSNARKQIPWLIVPNKSSQGYVRGGFLEQVGPRFRWHTEAPQKPLSGAVFRCLACGSYAVRRVIDVIIGNTVYCSRQCPGWRRNDNSPIFWRDIVARHSEFGEPIQPEWLNSDTGHAAFTVDMGAHPKIGHYLCRRISSIGWTRQNVYWRRLLRCVERTTCDDEPKLVMGHLQQIGATILLPMHPAVFYCAVCKTNVIEQRDQITRNGYDRCTSCREPGRILEYQGQRKTVTTWAHDLGLRPKLIFDRLRHGWTAERALTQPQRTERKRRSASPSTQGTEQHQ